MSFLSAPARPTADLRPALLADRTHTLMRLYRHTFPQVQRLVQRQGGTDEDARDVFQDALVLFYEKTVAGQLVLTSSAGTYLVSVSRNLWRRELQRRQQQPHASLGAEHEDVADTADAPETLPVLAYLEQLGERCKSILLSFYYFQQPLEQIAATHGYGSVRSATVQKFKCLERLRQAVRTAVRETLFA